MSATAPPLPESIATGLPDHPPLDPTLSETTEVRFSSSHQAIGLTLRVDTNDARIHRAALESFGPVLERVDGPDATVRLFTHHVQETVDWRPHQPLVRNFGQLVTVVVAFLIFLFAAYCAFDGHVVLTDGDVEVFLFDARRLSADYDIVFAINDVNFGQVTIEGQRNIVCWPIETQWA